MFICQFVATLNVEQSGSTLVRRAATLTLSPFSSPTGGLLSTISGTHGGGGSVESRNGGEELSTPAVKRRREENSVSRLGPPICGESITLPRQVTHPHPPHYHPQNLVQHSNIQTPSHPLYNPFIHPTP